VILPELRRGFLASPRSVEEGEHVRAPVRGPRSGRGRAGRGAHSPRRGGPLHAALARRGALARLLCRAGGAAHDPSRDDPAHRMWTAFAHIHGLLDSSGNPPIWPTRKTRRTASPQNEAGAESIKRRSGKLVPPPANSAKARTTTIRMSTKGVPHCRIRNRSPKQLFARRVDLAHPHRAPRDLQYARHHPQNRALPKLSRRRPRGTGR